MSETDGAPGLAERVGRTMLAQDNASRAFGMALEEIAPGRARMRMTVRDDMINGHDLCHGGLIFAFADSTFAFACNARNQVTVAAGAEIHFVSPASKGETLIAAARERAGAGRTGIYDVEVTEAATGRLVALFRGRAYRVGGTIVEENAPS
jgi:acyl-CoA thioesterase